MIKHCKPYLFLFSMAFSFFAASMDVQKARNELGFYQKTETPTGWSSYIRSGFQNALNTVKSYFNSPAESTQSAKDAFLEPSPEFLVLDPKKPEPKKTQLPAELSAAQSHQHITQATAPAIEEKISSEERLPTENIVKKAKIRLANLAKRKMYHTTMAQQKKEEEEFFESVFEQSLYKFPEYMKEKGIQEREKIVKEDIFKELIDENESEEARNKLFEYYKTYTLHTQLSFITILLKIYNQATPQEKTAFISAFFTVPEGILYDKDKSQEKTENNSKAARAYINKDFKRKSISIIVDKEKNYTFSQIFNSEDPIKLMLFSEQGTYLAISYEDHCDVLAQRQYERHTAFRTTWDTKYEKIWQSEKNIPIIGLLFMSEHILLILNDQNNISLIDLREKNK